MRRVLFLIIKLILVCHCYSCGDLNKVQTVEKAGINGNLKAENQKSKNEQTDSLVQAVNFLKSEDIISEHFDSEKAVNISTYSSDNGINYYHLTLEFDTSIGEQFFSDPYVNFIYVKDAEQKLIDYMVLYSLETSEIKYSFEYDNNPVFLKYDSTTGWSKYYFYSMKNSRFYETKELDEQEFLIKEGLDFYGLTYRTNYGKNEDFYFIPSDIKTKLK